MIWFSCQYMCSLQTFWGLWTKILEPCRAHPELFKLSFLDELIICIFVKVTNDVYTFIVNNRCKHLLNISVSTN